MLRSLLCVASLLSLTTVASAGTAGFNVHLTYSGSYDASGNQMDDLAWMRTTSADGSTKTLLQLNSTAVVHAFTVSVSVHDLAADQDAGYFQFRGNVSGGVAFGDGAAGGMVSGDPYVTSSLSNTTVDPTAMGNTTSGSSNASSAIPWFENSINPQNNFLWLAKRGVTETGNGNGTYGDYMAAMAVGENSPYEMGTLYLSTTDVTNMGTFSLSFVTDAEGYFGVLSQNGGDYGLGMGTSATWSWPVNYSAVGDSIEFTPAPEPSTIALLLSSIIGLATYAWRKRR